MWNWAPQPDVTPSHTPSPSHTHPFYPSTGREELHECLSLGPRIFFFKLSTNSRAVRGQGRHPPGSGKDSGLYAVTFRRAGYIFSADSEQ